MFASPPSDAQSMSTCRFAGSRLKAHLGQVTDTFRSLRRRSSWARETDGWLRLGRSRLPDDEGQDSRSHFWQQLMVLIDLANEPDSPGCFLPVETPDAAGPGVRVPVHHSVRLIISTLLGMVCQSDRRLHLDCLPIPVMALNIAGAGRGGICLSSHRRGYHCLSMLWPAARS